MQCASSFLAFQCQLPSSGYMGKRTSIFVTFNCIHCLQCDPHQQEWLAHTPQLPVSHWADVWSFCRRHQSDQLTFCVSNCKLLFSYFFSIVLFHSTFKMHSAQYDGLEKTESSLSCWSHTFSQLRGPWQQQASLRNQEKHQCLWESECSVSS